MKKHLKTLLVGTLLAISSGSMAKVQHLLPKPQQIAATENVAAFDLSGSVTINYSEGAEKCTLLEEFFTTNGCTVAESGGKTVNVTMVESIPGAYDYTLYGYENEAYTLDVTADAINITAIKPIGVIRAAQTLVQMAEGWDGTAALEAVSIKDWPAFKLRGYMHDVGRSFISADELEDGWILTTPLSKFKPDISDGREFCVFVLLRAFLWVLFFWFQSMYFLFLLFNFYFILKHSSFTMLC